MVPSWQSWILSQCIGTSQFIQGDHDLLGLPWHDRVFIDTCLPFGLHLAPKIFNATADALGWIIGNEGETFVKFVINYLDDFLFGGSPKSESCSSRLDLALRICNQVGLPVMTEKVFGPNTILEFLASPLTRCGNQATRGQYTAPQVSPSGQEVVYKMVALISHWELAACKCGGQTWLGISSTND